MPGPVALIGAGEFLPAMADFDAGSARSRPVGRARASRSCRPPRIPTARRSSTAGRRWASPTSGRSAPRSSRSSSAIAPGPTIPAAAQAIGEADLIYLSGGKPGYLLERPERERRRGGARGGPRARRGPGRLLGRGDGPRRAGVRLPVPASRRGRCAGGRGSGSCRAPRSCRTTTRGRSRCRALIALQAPRGSVVLGIDEETAVVGRDGAWQVHGRSRVTVWRGRHRERYRAGDTFRF